MEVVDVPLSSLAHDEKNARKHNSRNIEEVKRSLAAFGQHAPLVVQRKGSRVLVGNARLEAMRALGWETAAVVFVDDDDETAVRRALADNRTAELAEWDDAVLAELLSSLEELVDIPGWTDDELRAMVDELSGEKAALRDAAVVTLRERFIVPPFSVLDARQGYWAERKRAWINLGIRGERGRGAGDDGEEGLLYTAQQLNDPQYYTKKRLAEMRLGRELSKAEFERDYYTPPEAVGFSSGTSVFDPVLCECVYSWFAPVGGRVLDPFAGGVVRGAVATLLGRRYVGVDLSERQIRENLAQWEHLRGVGLLVEDAGVELEDNVPDLTPVESHGGYYVKRDDLFCVAGQRGGKVRTCWGLAQGAKGLVTAGSRQSPQVNIVAHIARRLGIPCQVHVPSGGLTPELVAAKDAGAEIVQHKAGYNSVIVARCREAAERLGWREIPFGMECEEAVLATSKQVANIPEGVSRLVVPVGSGMSLSGILRGLQEAGRDLPVLGISVGADPSKRLDKWAPAGWRSRVELVRSDLDYHDAVHGARLGGLLLDPIYEAKCLPFLRDGDCLWVVGRRSSVEEDPGARVPGDPEWVIGDSLMVRDLVEGPFDFLFSCPPYHDLEVYSDDPRDLSAMDFEGFSRSYAEIIRRSCDLLADNRFACFVVGDIRDGNGLMRNFVSMTIRAFLDAGLRLYNEAVLVTSVGTLPIRTRRQFEAARKMGKAHQNVLVFVKGDPFEGDGEDVLERMFRDGRDLVSDHEKVLVFSKGDPVLAAKNCGKVVVGMKGGGK